MSDPSTCLCVDLPGRDAAPPPAGTHLGGKALSLWRLASAGLSTPEGFVVDGRLLQDLRAGGPPLPPALASQEMLDALAQAQRTLLNARLPEDAEAEILDRLTAMGPGARLSVRSSFATEADPGTLAAGVYESRTSIPAAAALPAIKAVLASALSPGAFTYARAHGLDPGAVTGGVLVHRFIAGDASGAAAWHPAHDPPAVVEPREGAAPLSAAARGALLGALQALAAEHGPVEVEWVAEGDHVTFLQLRPYIAPARRPWSAGVGLGDEWRWDAAHNPLPLSPAQAGLVELVDRACALPFRQRVAGGYLLYAPEPQPVSDAAPLAPEALPAAFTTLRDACTRRLAELGDAPDLEPALALFVDAYQPLFARIQPAARAARRALEELLAAAGRRPEDDLPRLLAAVPSVAQDRALRATRIRASRDPVTRIARIREYLDEYGDDVSVWDVAAPTLAESPRLLETLHATAHEANTAVARAATAEDLSAAPSEWQRALDEIAADLDPGGRARLPGAVAAARAAAAVSEDDDLLYARVQAAVRRALLAEGERLAGRAVLDAAADVFWLPLDRAREAARARHTLDAREARALVAAARAAYAEQLREPPSLAAEPARRPLLLRGQPGAPGRAIGRVVLHATPSAIPPPSASETVLVATTLLPTELPLVSCAAVVVETGGRLDHVAAQARERGLPAVVGARGAVSALSAGDLVLVDGDAGIVTRLTAP